MRVPEQCRFKAEHDPLPSLLALHWQIKSCTVIAHCSHESYRLVRSLEPSSLSSSST